MARLTHKQKRFVEEYIKLGNGEKAAIAAGFAKKGAGVASCRMLKDPKIREYYDELFAQVSQKTLVDAEYVINGLKEVAERCMQRKPVMVFNHIEKKLEQEVDENGEGVWEFDSSGANKALELLGKHAGAFEKDNDQKKGTIVVEITD